MIQIESIPNIEEFIREMEYCRLCFNKMMDFNIPESRKNNTSDKIKEDLNIMKKKIAYSGNLV